MLRAIKDFGLVLTGNNEDQSIGLKSTTREIAVVNTGIRGVMQDTGSKPTRILIGIALILRTIVLVGVFSSVSMVTSFISSAIGTTSAFVRYTNEKTNLPLAVVLSPVGLVFGFGGGLVGSLIGFVRGVRSGVISGLNGGILNMMEANLEANAQPVLIAHKAEMDEEYLEKVRDAVVEMEFLSEEV